MGLLVGTGPGTRESEAAYTSQRCLPNSLANGLNIHSLMARTKEKFDITPPFLRRYVPCLTHYAPRDFRSSGRGECSCEDWVDLSMM